MAKTSMVEREKKRIKSSKKLFAKRKALKEAHPDYPVPKFMDLNSCELLFESLLTKK